ncbi:MAG: SIS domain-containing protein [Clostridiales bacterium]|jgi:D-sedoheptulose 7-phosphate isomerase|nr:SIS domain-containing protein [Clostridiales bacterium]
MSYLSNYTKATSDALNKTISTFDGKQQELDEAFEQWIHLVHDRKEKDGTFFFCGNGASCTMAEHLSHDCFQNADMKTYTISETSHITAISNDISYDDVFAYRIGKIGTPNDVLITISSSGNSPNVIKAINTAHEKGMFVVTLSGKGEDNKSRKFGDLNFYVPLPTYGLVESAHAVLLHALLDAYLDKFMGGKH